MNTWFSLLRIKILDDMVPYDKMYKYCWPRFYYTKDEGIFPALFNVEEYYYDVFVPLDAEKIIIRHGRNKVELPRSKFIVEGKVVKAFMLDINDVPTTEESSLHAAYAVRGTGCIYMTWVLPTPTNVVVAVPDDATMVEIEMDKSYSVVTTVP